MKKILALLMISAIVLSLSACGKSKSSSGDFSGESLQTSGNESSDVLSGENPDAGIEESSDDNYSSDKQSDRQESSEPVSAGAAVSDKAETDKPSKPSATQETKPSESASTPNAPQPADTPDKETPENNNVFFNESNNTYDTNQVSVKPRYVYWKDGKLIAECFVINGCSVPVYNINVKGLSFANDSVNIASAGFGYINNIVLQPYTNIVWTFEFGADTVISYGADLNLLYCNYNVSFDH